MSGTHPEKQVWQLGGGYTNMRAVERRDDRVIAVACAHAS